MDRSFIQHTALNLSTEFPLLNNCRSKQLLHFLLPALAAANKIKGANGTYTIKSPSIQRCIVTQEERVFVTNSPKAFKCISRLNIEINTDPYI